MRWPHSDNASMRGVSPNLQFGLPAGSILLVRCRFCALCGAVGRCFAGYAIASA
jgi:hypothetical protein